jgi:predicted dehydrogenase
LSPRRPTYRVGIIGTGFAAESHADALRRLPNVELAGIASRDPARAQESADRLGAVRGYPDPDQLIEDERIDAVHVCTINRLHSELSARALQAGKHVVTEKPLGTDSATTERLAALAEQAARSGRRAAVCFNYRHYALIQRLREMLASGEYGEMHFVHGSYVQDWLLYETDWNWRLDPADNGVSRAVADIGSHWLDLVQHVSGQRVSEVFADLGMHHAVRQRPRSESSTFGNHGGGAAAPVAVQTEDFGAVIMRFASGARGTFAVSQVSPGRKNRLTFQVDTAEAAFSWDQEQPNVAWVGRRRSPSLVYPREPTAAGTGPQLPAGHPEGWRDALRNLFAEFYGGIEPEANGGGRGGSFATFADGHRTTLLVEAIVQSHRTRGWVKVADHETVRA